MTGFGEASGREGEARVQIAISSVNSRRGLDLNLSLPRELLPCEEGARGRIQKEVARARMNVQVELETRSSDRAGVMEISPEALKYYLRQCEGLKKKGLIRRDPDPEFLIKLPGVLKDPPVGEKRDCRVLFEKVLSRALSRYQAARRREGKVLRSDLLKRLARIGLGVKNVNRRRPQVVAAYRNLLLNRLKQAGFPDLDLVHDERILKEVALFADRSDVSEEVTRLEAHLKEGRRLCDAPEPSGKNLDFLVQEIGREINTIGSKSNDLKISRAVLEMKAELEKIREQVQNIE